MNIEECLNESYIAPFFFVICIKKIGNNSKMKFFVKVSNSCHSQEMEFGWKIVLGSLITCCGAIFGSVGGVGGGGIFVPMLTLVMGFDPKSATAISKCELKIIY